MRGHGGRTALCMAMALMFIAPLSPAQEKQMDGIPYPALDGGNDTQYWAVIIATGSETRDATDVNDLRTTLIGHGWKEGNIKLLIEEEATKEEILTTPFEWLNESGADADDVILFFFSMHGEQMEDQQPLDEPDGMDEYLIPYDYDRESGNNSMVDDELSVAFDGLRSRNIVIIFETCHSGGMVDGTEDLGKGGRVVLMSCAADESSGPLFIKKRWLFPYYLIKGMKGDADANGDGWVSAEESFYYAEIPTILRSSLLSLIFLLHPFVRLRPQHPQIYDGWPSQENSGAQLKLVNLSWRKVL